MASRKSDTNNTNTFVLLAALIGAGATIIAALIQAGILPGRETAPPAPTVQVRQTNQAGPSLPQSTPPGSAAGTSGST